VQPTVFCCFVHTVSRVQGVCACACVCVCVRVRALVILGSNKVVFNLRVDLFYFKGMLLLLYCILCIEVCIVHNCISLTVGLRFNMNNLVW
jgi:hypothetical protein